MAEFASTGVGNAGLATGIIGTALGVMNSGGLGGVFGGFGRNGYGYGMDIGNSACMAAQTAMRFGDHYATKEDLHYVQELARKDSEIALLKSEQNTEVKIADVYARLKGDLLTLERNQNDWNTSQSVANAKMSAAIHANNESIDCLKHGFDRLTRLVIPADRVCPEPMPRYNTWREPIATEAPATGA